MTFRRELNGQSIENFHMILKVVVVRIETALAFH
jgi:hypothetical protein